MKSNSNPFGINKIPIKICPLSPPQQPDSITLESIVPKYFDPDKLFNAPYSYKTYEKIPVETGCCSFEHHDANKAIHFNSLPLDIPPQYSKIKIFNILSEDDWKQPFYLPKKIMFADQSGNHEIIFDHRDYQKAWEVILFYQNHDFHHAWFIRVKLQNPSQIPMWFLLKFWVPFGASREILPNTIQNIYEKYHLTMTEQQKNFLLHLQFCS